MLKGKRARKTAQQMLDVLNFDTKIDSKEEAEVQLAEAIREQFYEEPTASPMSALDYLGTRIGSNAKLHDELGRILPRLYELPQGVFDDGITNEIAGVLKRSPKLCCWTCVNPYQFERAFEIGGVQLHASARYCTEGMIGGGLWDWQLSWFESIIREPTWSLAHATDEMAAWRIFLKRRFVTHDYESEQA